MGGKYSNFLTTLSHIRFVKINTIRIWKVVVCFVLSLNFRIFLYWRDNILHSI